MNGLLLLRRSASMALWTSLLAVAACGVDMSGLFDGDAAVDDAAPQDVAPQDGARDANVTHDRAPEVPRDATADGVPADRSFNDGTSLDAPLFDARHGDVAIDALRDSGGDVALDVDAAADRAADTRTDGMLDRDGARDAVNEPFIDAVTQDLRGEPPADVPVDRGMDAVADVAADTSGDAAPPGTCGGTCNTFPNISPTVTRTVVQGPPPTMTGGQIVDGTYVVSGVVHYSGDLTPFTIAETSVIAGNVDAWVSSINSAPTTRFTTTFTVTNNQMVMEFCCPTSLDLTITYTTDGVTLSHIDPANPNRVITYTRQ
jgi:hypothetical protein